MEIMVQKRKEKKLTQADLAQLVGCSQRAIAGYELEERKPSVTMAQKIGAELGFPWTKFFEGDTENGQEGQGRADERRDGDGKG